LRSAFSFAFESLTVTPRFPPGAIENAALLPASVSLPTHAPTVPAGQPKDRPD
jgi:hypothetical protein